MDLICKKVNKELNWFMQNLTLWREHIIALETLLISWNALYKSIMENAIQKNIVKTPLVKSRKLKEKSNERIKVRLFFFLKNILFLVLQLIFPSFLLQHFSQLFSPLHFFLCLFFSPTWNENMYSELKKKSLLDIIKMNILTALIPKIQCDM